MERDVKKSLINNCVPICEVSDQKDHQAFHISIPDLFIFY